MRLAYFSLAVNFALFLWNCSIQPCWPILASVSFWSMVWAYKSIRLERQIIAQRLARRLLA